MTISDLLNPGTPVMLSDSAPKSIKLAIGSEAVLTIFMQLGGMVEGDHFYRSYVCRHEHKGRLTFDHVEGGAIDERHLKVIGKEEAAGQKMLHDVQVEHGAAVLVDFLSGFSNLT